jgi:hypothetical protein
MVVRTNTLTNLRQISIVFIKIFDKLLQINPPLVLTKLSTMYT